MRARPAALILLLPGLSAFAADVLLVGPSVITLKAAIRYHFKTGQRDWPKT
jgi:ABC-type spermidine/putrescine transport system permease subunit I